MTDPICDPICNLICDLTTGQSIGRRDCQEDAVAGSFVLGCDLGFVVLADGMGGHTSGDIASRIVVTEVFSELMFQASGITARDLDVPSVLRDAAGAADACLAAHMRTDPATAGMGATLVAPVVLRDALWWISIGDSPLFLFRDGVLRQLNEDHSLAPQIDLMMAAGLMDRATGQSHPDRNVLTSALFGARIGRIDCPSAPLTLCAGDMVIAASDGLQFLDNDAIAGILAANCTASGRDILGALMQAVTALDHPDQDNVSVALIRVERAARAQEPAPALQHTGDSAEPLMRTA